MAIDRQIIDPFAKAAKSGTDESLVKGIGLKKDKKDVNVLGDFFMGIPRGVEGAIQGTYGALDKFIF